MATVRYDQRYTGSKLIQSPALEAENGGVISQTIRVDCGEKPLTTSDTGYVCAVAPYMQIISSSMKLITAEGDTATGDLGILGTDITADPNGLDDGVNFNTTAGAVTVAIPGTDAGLGINFGASGGYVGIVCDNNMSTAVIDVTITYAKSVVVDLLNQ